MMEAKMYHRKGYFTGWYPTVFTFQPVRLALRDGTPLHTEWYCNGVFSGTHYLTIMDDDGNGGLRCYHEYQIHAVKTQRIKELQSLMEQAVMAGVADPFVTIGTILDIIDIGKMPGAILAAPIEQPIPTPVYAPDEKVAAADGSGNA